MQPNIWKQIITLLCSPSGFYHIYLCLHFWQVRELANKTGMDFSEQIKELEEKYDQVRRDLYLGLTAVQRLSVARHPHRPTFLDHVLNITDKVIILHF
jgi:acetyl-CoA carboxylase alpha subunit